MRSFIVVSSMRKEGLLLHQAKGFRLLGILLHALLDVGIELVARQCQREQALLLLKLGKTFGFHGLFEGVCPPLVVGIANLGTEIEAANDWPLDVVALFLCSRN